MDSKEDLTIIQHKIGKYKRWWTHLYRCFCGNTFECLPARIKSRNTKSCGCLRAKMTRERNVSVQHRALVTKRGHTTTANKGRTRTYRIWRGMLQRTTKPNSIQWKYYGGRGISVCASIVRKIAAGQRDRSSLETDALVPSGKQNETT